MRMHAYPRIHPSLHPSRERMHIRPVWSSVSRPERRLLLLLRARVRACIRTHLRGTCIRGCKHAGTPSIPAGENAARRRRDTGTDAMGCLLYFIPRCHDVDICSAQAGCLMSPFGERRGSLFEPKPFVTSHLWPMIVNMFPLIVSTF